MSPPVRADAVRQGAGERLGLAPPRVKTRSPEASWTPSAGQLR